MVNLCIFCCSCDDVYAGVDLDARWQHGVEIAVVYRADFPAQKLLVRVEVRQKLELNNETAIASKRYVICVSGTRWPISVCDD